VNEGTSRDLYYGVLLLKY